MSSFGKLSVAVCGFCLALCSVGCNQGTFPGGAGGEGAAGGWTFPTAGSGWVPRLPAAGGGSFPRLPEGGRRAPRFPRGGAGGAAATQE